MNAKTGSLVGGRILGARGSDSGRYPSRILGATLVGIWVIGGRIVGAGVVGLWAPL